MDNAIRAALAEICSILVIHQDVLDEDEKESLDNAMNLIPEQYPCVDEDEE